MSRRHTVRIILTLVLAVAVLPGLAGLARGATKAATNTNGMNCIACHGNPKVVTSKPVFYDNSPGSLWLNVISLTDIINKNATADYLPPSLWSSATPATPFYSVVQGFNVSEHASTASGGGSLQCTSCHQTDPHDGLNGLPTWQNSCWGCHQSWSDLGNFASTPHAGNVLFPYFDQPSSGNLQAVTAINGGYDGGLLFQSNGKPVTMSERIAECSVCHSYLSRYPNQFPDGETPPPYPHEVGCGGCHDSHIQASTFFVANATTPFYTEGQTVQLNAWNTVTVENSPASGSTPVSTTSVVNTSWPPGEGRDTVGTPEYPDGAPLSYLNFKPFRVKANGAQDWVDANATWTRGSDFERPNRALVWGSAGTFSNSQSSGYLSDVFTLGSGSSGSISGVQPGNKLFITGTETKAVTLPSDYTGTGTVTVTANFYNAGFTVLSVNTSANSVQLYTTSSTFNPATGLNSSPTQAEQTGAVASVSVSYPSRTAKSGTNSTTVYLYPTDTSTGANFTLTSFTINDSYTNVEALCASCHAAGSYLYSSYAAASPGAKPGSAGTSSASTTMNLPVYDQFVNSAHADKTGTYAKFFMNPTTRIVGFPEFNAGNTNFAGSSPAQKLVYPFDMSLPGTNIPIPPTTYVGTQINAGDLSYTMTGPPSGVYLTDPNNTTLMTVNDSEFWHCGQCHHGLSTIDYQKDRQGPWGPGENLTALTNASVLWGDATLTCISCHDTHGDNTVGSIVRVPLKLSFHTDFASAYNPRGGLANQFLDGTAVPTNSSINNPVTGHSMLGVDTICVLCHQGLESGLTQYYTTYSTLNPGYSLNNPYNPAPTATVVDPLVSNSACTALDTPYSCCTGLGTGTCPWNTPNASLTSSSINQVHNLPEGAILWGKNAFETPGQYYSDNEAHQALNCSGCHMDTSVTDTTNQSTGHTFNPNVQTCEKCHTDGSSTLSNSNACGTNSISIFSTQSTSSLTVGTGGQSLTVPPGLSWLTSGLPVTITSATNLAQYMSGTVTSYTRSNGALAVDVTSVSGSGTNAFWNVATSNCDPFDTIQIPAGDNYAGPKVPLDDYPYTYQQIGSVIPATVNGSVSYGACSPTGSTTCNGLMGQLYEALYTAGIQYAGGYRPYSIIKGSAAATNGLSPAQVAAAFNFNMLSNAPHNFIHNYRYVVQILQDSIVGAGGTQVGVRPAGDRPATTYDQFIWSSLQY